MAIAKTDIELYVDEDNNFLPYIFSKYIQAERQSRGKWIQIKEGEEVPVGCVEQLRNKNPDQIELTESEMTSKLEETVKTEVKSVSKPKDTITFSVERRAELFALMRAEQIAMLTDHGLDKTEIKDLRLEKQRVQKLLELEGYK